tara:strand:+ start:185 stop:853 length:669 start_codon:yes stop_codon:yes gene_type:complete
MEISKRYERFEQLYVHDIYSKISSDFNVTRAYNWKAVKEFLNKMSVDSNGIDIGCGNGRNILFRPELRLIGIDKCEELVEVCKEKKLKVIKGDALAIPFKKNSFDYAMSIAVFHHLSNSKRRHKALNEMIRILKSGGVGLLSVWSLEQPESSRRKFTLGDNLVKWKFRDPEHNHNILETFDRYYYISDYADFIKYIDNFKDVIHVDKIFNEHGNWYCEFTKL